MNVAFVNISIIADHVISITHWYPLSRCNMTSDMCTVNQYIPAYHTIICLHCFVWHTSEKSLVTLLIQLFRAVALTLASGETAEKYINSNDRCIPS